MWTFHVLSVKTKAFHNFLDVMQCTINPDTQLEVGNCDKVQAQLPAQLVGVIIRKQAGHSVFRELIFLGLYSDVIYSRFILLLFTSNLAFFRFTIKKKRNVNNFLHFF